MTLSRVKKHYQDPEVAQTYDDERFSNFVGRTFDSLEKRTIAIAVRSIQKESPISHVLDVPCGTGRIAESLLQMGLTVTGADISLPMMQIAEQKCAAKNLKLNTLQLDLTAPTTLDTSYDLVTCIRLLHHLDSDERAKVMCSLSQLTSRYVLINVAFSSPFYRLRRRVKRTLRQGHSMASSTWEEIHREASSAQLRILRHFFVRRYFTEDLILILEKA